MSGSDAAGAMRGKVECSRLVLEFSSTQLEFTTNSPEVHSFMERTFVHMVTAERGRTVGSLSVQEENGRFEVRGFRSFSFDGSPSALFDPLKDDVLFQFVRARPELLWLHAAVVARGGSATLLIGPSGHGKSTLSTGLAERGWDFLSDDVAPVSMDNDLVFPYPQLPLRRLYPGRAVRRDQLGELQREAVRVPHVRRGPATVREVVFPVFETAASARLTPLSRGDAALALLKNLTNFVDHKAAAVDRAAQLARDLPASTLVFSTPSEALNLLESLNMA